jgi:hypothetical protein
MIKKWGN